MEQFVRAINQVNKGIGTDYLSENVGYNFESFTLSRQPENIRGFDLTTETLQKDTANLCSRLRNENFMLEGKIYRE